MQSLSPERKMIAPSVAGRAPNLAICAAGSLFAVALTTLNVFVLCLTNMHISNNPQWEK
jgi:hypothetical protein